MIAFSRWCKPGRTGQGKSSHEGEATLRTKGKLKEKYHGQVDKLKEVYEVLEMESILFRMGSVESNLPVYHLKHGGTGAQMQAVYLYSGWDAAMG